MADIERIAAGVYVIDTPCPRCGALSEITARIGSTLTESDDDEPAMLRVKLSAKAREHECGSRRWGDVTLFHTSVGGPDAEPDMPLTPDGGA